MTPAVDRFQGIEDESRYTQTGDREAGRNASRVGPTDPGRVGDALSSVPRKAGRTSQESAVGAREET